MDFARLLDMIRQVRETLGHDVDFALMRDTLSVAAQWIDVIEKSQRLRDSK